MNSLTNTNQNHNHGMQV